MAFVDLGRLALLPLRRGQGLGSATAGQNRAQMSSQNSRRHKEESLSRGLRVPAESRFEPVRTHSTTPAGVCLASCRQHLEPRVPRWTGLGSPIAFSFLFPFHSALVDRDVTSEEWPRMYLRSQYSSRSCVPELRIARTPEELEAVARLRYDVYVEELGRDRACADHEARTLHEPLDEEGIVIGAFTREGCVVGTIRLTPSTAHGLSCRTMYGFEPREAVCPGGIVVASKLIVAAGHRGTHLGLQIIRSATRIALRRGWRFCFLVTYENLVALYQRVGFVNRRHSVHPIYGEVIIMEWDMLDVEHLRAVRSPMLKDVMAFISDSVSAA